MKIGVFDSGLGGLIVLKAIRELLPSYDYLYLGDTKRLPYGKLKQETIYQYTKEAMDYLFSQECQLIVIACNTISTGALRRIQREYLPGSFPDRRVLGVVVPTVEAVCEYLSHQQTKADAQKIGVLGTQATVRSNAYIREFRKANPRLTIVQRTASRLVKLIEDRRDALAKIATISSVKPLVEEGVQAIVLGCTHYCLVKSYLRTILNAENETTRPLGVKIISQDEVVPLKLADYLKRHPEIDMRLSQTGRLDLRVTKLTSSYEELAEEWFSSNCTLQEMTLND